MLLYIIDCKNSEQADEITTVLFKETLVIRVYKIDGIKISSFVIINHDESRQGTLLLVLGKALLYNKIEDKVNSFPGTFLVGIPVSAVNWDKISPLLEKTQKV